VIAGHRRGAQGPELSLHQASELGQPHADDPTQRAVISRVSDPRCTLQPWTRPGCRARSASW
jgi:hypothetical protein